MLSIGMNLIVCEFFFRKYGRQVVLIEKGEGLNEKQ